MTENFNKLTPKQTELLAMLAEEAGEIVQVVGKILRHGYDSYNPDDPKKTPNHEYLIREIIDLKAVTEAMIDNTDLREYNDIELKHAWERKLKYSHHQLDQ